MLLIAESAPDDGGDIANRRFFYEENLTGKDALFREVVRAFYDEPPLTSGPNAKTPWLEKLRDDCVYLIDLAAAPVNYHSAVEREEALKQNINETVRLARELDPTGIVLIKQNVFNLLERPIRTAGLPLLHDAMIPFPGSGQQKRFRKRFTDALARLEPTNPERK